MATVTIKDVASNRLLNYTLTDDHKNLVSKNWNSPDRLLKDLEAHPLFLNKTKWSELDSKQFRILITQNLNLLFGQDEKSIEDLSHPVIKSFLFLTAGLLYHVQCVSMSSVGSINMTRVSKTDVMFDINISYDRLSIGSLKPKLSIVVDNTNLANTK